MPGDSTPALLSKSADGSAMGRSLIFTFDIPEATVGSSGVFHPGRNKNRKNNAGNFLS